MLCRAEKRVCVLAENVFLMLIYFPVVPVNSTCDFDLDRVKLNRFAQYLGQMFFHLKIIIRTDTHTHWTQCSVWTTEVVGKILTKQYLL